MRFKELYDTLTSVYTKDNVRKIKNLSDLGAFTFPKPITDKDATETPHYIMNKCLDMATENPIVSSAIEQLLSFIFPGKNIRVKTKHKKSKKWMEKWMSLRPRLKEELYKLLFTNVATGNAALQYIIGEKGENKGKLDDVFCLNDISRLYYNPDHKNIDEKYVYSIPLTVNEFYFDGKRMKPQFFNVKYIAGDVFFVKQVYGVPVSGEKLAMYITGWDRSGFYGRSSLASNIDVDNIMREIMSSWDTISKLKQIDQKIITPDGNGMYDVANQQYQNLIKLLEEGRGSYLFIPFQVKLLQQDIRTSKGYDTMVEVMEFLRRQIMMGLLPQHLTPWGDSSTTQGSEASLPPFLARVKSKQQEFIEFLNCAIIGKLRESYPFLSEDLTFELDAPEIMGQPYYIKMITGLKREGIITPQQAIAWMRNLGILSEKCFTEEKDIDEKIIDPFKMVGADALTFKPNDIDARSDAKQILDAIKQKEEQQKWKRMNDENPMNDTDEGLPETKKVLEEVEDENKEEIKKQVKGDN